MHFLSMLFPRPALHPLETPLVPALNDPKALESRLLKENGPLPGDLIERVLSYLPIDRKSDAGALARVSIQFYFHSRRLREHAHLYACTEFLRTETSHDVASKRLERIVIELCDPNRNWHEQNKGSILANAIRNGLACADGAVTGKHVPEKEAAYFFALNARTCVPAHDVGPVLYELLGALPVVGADRRAATLDLLRPATTALTGPDSAEWRLRCRIRLMNSEPDHAVMEVECEDITAGVGELPSAARARTLAELLRFASGRNDVPPQGDIATIDLIYGHAQAAMEHLDPCDRAPVLVSMTKLFKSRPTGMTPAALFVAIADSTQPITMRAARTQVLTVLARQIEMIQPGAPRGLALRVLLEHASKLPDQYKASVAQALPLNLYVSKYGDQFEHEAVERLGEFYDSLGEPYRTNTRDQYLWRILDRYEPAGAPSYVTGLGYY